MCGKCMPSDFVRDYDSAHGCIARSSPKKSLTTRSHILHRLCLSASVLFLDAPYPTLTPSSPAVAAPTSTSLRRNRLFTMSGSRGESQCSRYGYLKQGRMAGTGHTGQSGVSGYSNWITGPAKSFGATSHRRPKRDSERYSFKMQVVVRARGPMSIRLSLITSAFRKTHSTWSSPALRVNVFKCFPTWSKTFV